MSMDPEMFEEYLNKIADHFTAEELVLEMGLDVWDIIEMFRDRLEEKPVDIERYRKE